MEDIILKLFSQLKRKYLLYKVIPLCIYLVTSFNLFLAIDAVATFFDLEPVYGVTLKIVVSLFSIFFLIYAALQYRRITPTFLAEKLDELPESKNRFSSYLEIQDKQESNETKNVLSFLINQISEDFDKVNVEDHLNFTKKNLFISLILLLLSFILLIQLSSEVTKVTTFYSNINKQEINDLKEIIKKERLSEELTKKTNDLISKLETTNVHSESITKSIKDLEDLLKKEEKEPEEKKDGATKEKKDAKTEDRLKQDQKKDSEKSKLETKDPATNSKNEQNKKPDPTKNGDAQKTDIQNSQTKEDQSGEEKPNQNKTEKGQNKNQQQDGQDQQAESKEAQNGNGSGDGQKNSENQNNGQEKSDSKPTKGQGSSDSNSNEGGPQDSKDKSENKKGGSQEDNEDLSSKDNLKPSDKNNNFNTQEKGSKGKESPQDQGNKSESSESKNSSDSPESIKQDLKNKLHEIKQKQNPTDSKKPTDGEKEKENNKEKSANNSSQSENKERPSDKPDAKPDDKASGEDKNDDKSSDKSGNEKQVDSQEKSSSQGKSNPFGGSGKDPQEQFNEKEVKERKEPGGDVNSNEDLSTDEAKLEDLTLDSDLTNSVDSLSRDGLAEGDFGRTNSKTAVDNSDFEKPQLKPDAKKQPVPLEYERIFE